MRTRPKALLAPVLAALAVAAALLPSAFASPPTDTFGDQADWMRVLTQDFCQRVPTHPKCAASPAPSIATPATTPVVTVKPTASPSPTPTPTPSPVITPSPSASAGPGAQWTLRVREDFNTTAAEGSFLSAYPNWTAYPLGWTDSSHNGHYDPSIVSVHDGMADIFIRTTAGNHRVASISPALVGTDHNQLYGRYEIRWKADSMRGYKEAWLLWPKSEVWPRDGEQDFPEGDLDGHVSAFMHRQGATSGSDQDAFSTSIAMAGSWHTSVLEWTPAYVKFILDGSVIGTVTARIPNTPMRWQIQNETSLSGIVPADTTQGHILIDYAAVWAYTP